MAARLHARRRFAAGALVAFPLWLLPSLAISGAARAASLRKGPYLQRPAASSIEVLWETSDPLPGTVHLVDPAAPGGERLFPPPSAPNPPVTLHRTVVNGLEPGRRYPYYVTSGDLRSDTGSLAAAPRPYEPFTFIAWGDNRNFAADHRAVVERFVRDAPDLIVNTGDLTDKGLPWEWQQFFAIEHEALRDAPCAPAMGNHDYDGLRHGNLGFATYFDPPSEAPPGELYYAFTFGNSRFVVLDTNVYLFALSDETAWLERQVREARADPAIRHVFVFMHQPALSSSSHGGTPGIRDAWGPLFERYQVDVVFAGHDHAYERSEENGIRYIVTGGGGAPLYGEKNPADAEDRTSLVIFEKVHHYVRVHVVGDAIAITVVRADGSVIETLQQGRPPSGACRVAHDCDGLAHAGCDGAWRCADHGCSFRCGAAADPYSASASPPAAASASRALPATAAPSERPRSSRRALLVALPIVLGVLAVGWALARREL